MRAELKAIYSPDIDLSSYWPEDEKKFGFLLEASIGSDIESGSDIFQIMVCSPDWLKEHYAEDRITWGRHMLIALEYDIDLIKSKLESYIKNCTGKDWIEIAHKLSKIGGWEFEDYHS